MSAPREPMWAAQELAARRASEEVRRLEAEVERLREELRITQFDANVARGECDMAIAAATMDLRHALERVVASPSDSFDEFRCQRIARAALEASSEPRP